MVQQYTQNDIVRYLYNETNKEESKAMEQALTENWELKEACDELRQSMGILDKIKLRSPSQSSINLILNYGSKQKLEALT